MELVFIIWLTLSVAVGFLANRRGRSGIAYAVFAMILSPLLVAILLLCAKDLRAEAKADSERTERAERERAHMQQLEAIRASTAPQTTSMSVADEIAKLGGLRDKGLITDAEFDAQKAAVLKPR